MLQLVQREYSKTIQNCENGLNKANKGLFCNNGIGICLNSINNSCVLMWGSFSAKGSLFSIDWGN